jgi:hypothetical protein
MTANLALLPASAAADQAKHKAVIALSAKIQDWPTLLFAIDDMLADQRDFIAWWDEHVHRKGGERWLDPADRQDQQLSMDAAEGLTGIKNWQVSRWRTALKTEDAYREAIIGAARKRAGFEPQREDPAAQRGQPLRDGPDFWPTPDTLIEAARQHLVPFLPPGPIWECAAGDGQLGRGIGADVLTDKYPQDGSAALDFTVDNPPAPDLLAFTNQPFNAADDFLRRGLELLDAEAIRGFVLLLRHDHFMAGGKVEALNRAVLEVHCNWRPTWIPDTLGNPRWAFAWVYWGPGERRPPLYLREGGAT